MGSLVIDVIVKKRGAGVFIEELIKMYYLLCKNKRKRRSTKQLIKDILSECGLEWVCQNHAA